VNEKEKEKKLENMKADGKKLAATLLSFLHISRKFAFRNKHKHQQWLMPSCESIISLHSSDFKPLIIAR
jgi:hypothetical protein